MTEARRNLKDYGSYQTPQESNLDYDAQRDKEVKDQEQLKEKLDKKCKQ